MIHLVLLCFIKFRLPIQFEGFPLKNGLFLPCCQLGRIMCVSLGLLMEAFANLIKCFCSCCRCRQRQKLGSLGRRDEEAPQLQGHLFSGDVVRRPSARSPVRLSTTRHSQPRKAAARKPRLHLGHWTYLVNDFLYKYSKGIPGNTPSALCFILQLDYDPGLKNIERF